MPGIVDQSTAVTATSKGVTVTSSATANEKGSWVELIASTSEETFWVQLIIQNVPTSNTKENFLLDIGTGVASSEVVKIADVSVYVTNSVSTGYLFPLTIPAGTRVSVSCQDIEAIAQTIEVMLFLSNNSDYGTSTANETFGTNSSNSVGTAIVADDTTDNTKGAYSELVASSGIAVNYLVVMPGYNNNPSITPTQSFLYDISIGVASSEVVQIANLNMGMNTAEATNGPGAYFHDIASGTRIAVRCQSDGSVIAGAADRQIDVSIIGFNIVAPSGGGGGVAKLAGSGGGLVG